jgi:hypothetical protein
MIRTHTLITERLAQSAAEIKGLEKRQEFLVRQLAENSDALITATRYNADLRLEYEALMKHFGGEAAPRIDPHEYLAKKKAEAAALETGKAGRALGEGSY